VSVSVSDCVVPESVVPESVVPESVVPESAVCVCDVFAHHITNNVITKLNQIMVFFIKE